MTTHFNLSLGCRLDRRLFFGPPFILSVKIIAFKLLKPLLNILRVLSGNIICTVLIIIIYINQGFGSVKSNLVFSFYCTVLPACLPNSGIQLSEALLINSPFEIIFSIQISGGYEYKTYVKFTGSQSLNYENIYFKIDQQIARHFVHCSWREFDEHGKFN